MWTTCPEVPPDTSLVLVWRQCVWWGLTLPPHYLRPYGPHPLRLRLDLCRATMRRKGAGARGENEGLRVGFGGIRLRREDSRLFLNTACFLWGLK